MEKPCKIKLFPMSDLIFTHYLTAQIFNFFYGRYQIIRVNKDIQLTCF